MHRETLDLIRRLNAWRWPHYAAALAVVLAHVSTDSPRSIMRACGRSSFGAHDALLSHNRFRRLMNVRGADDLMTALIRIARMMRGQCSIEDLTETMQRWNDRTRQRWAAEYFAAIPTENETENQKELAQ